MRQILASAIGLLLLAAPVTGQSPVVYMNHAPGRLELQHVNPDRGNGRWDGAIPPLPAFAGENACVRVENGNPLLYIYELTAKEDTSTRSFAALKPIVTAISTLVPGANVTAAFTPQGNQKSIRQFSAADQDALVNYAAILDSLIASTRALERYRFDSDQTETISQMLKEISQRADMVRRQNAGADRGYAIASKIAEIEAAVRLLRAVQNQAFEHARALEKEYHGAIDRYRPEICRKVGTNRTILTLTVKRRSEIPDGQTTSRAVPAPVEFVVEPRSPAVFEVSVGAAWAYVPSRRTYRLEDGVVVMSDADRWSVAMGVFGTWRPDRNWPLWAALGVLDGETDQPDILAGVTFKPFDLSVPSINLGAGVLFARTPVALKRNATEGAPLPTGISALKDVVESGRRLGFAIVLNLSGIKLPSTR